MRSGRRAFAAQWGYESIETDWRKVVDSPEIDLIDIASPNDTHAEIAIAAAKAGKMVMCEKPLGRNAAEAEAMVEAVEAAGVPNMVWYNYRRVPAVTLAKHLIDEGRLGRIFHYRAKFLQDWTISTDLPQGGEGLWRLDVSVAGSGVTGDLLAHCIDTAMWLNGPIDEVSAMTETFIKSRKHNLTGKVEPVGIDDASAVPGAIPERLAGDFRGDAVRARPQGALHVRDQRRARVDLVGPARSAPAAVLRSSRRRPAARLAQPAHHRPRPSLYGATGGCRGCRSGTSTRSCTSSRISWRRRRRGRARRRRSATGWRPTMSRMRCWHSAANRNWVKVARPRGRRRRERHCEDARRFAAFGGWRVGLARNRALDVAPAGHCAATLAAARGLVRSQPLEESGVQAYFRWEESEGLGLRSGFLARGGRGDRRRDEGRSSAAAEYLLHLARRQAGGLRAEAAVQADRRGYRQQRHSVSQRGAAGSRASGC